MSAPAMASVWAPGPGGGMPARMDVPRDFLESWMSGHTRFQSMHELLNGHCADDMRGLREAMGAAGIAAGPGKERACPGQGRQEA